MIDGTTALRAAETATQSPVFPTANDHDGTTGPAKKSGGLGFGGDMVWLPGGGWRLWGEFALRGPGFATAGVLRLAPAGLAGAADGVGALSGEGWEVFQSSFDGAMVDGARVLQEIAGLPRFRAAVAWQNRAVLDTALRPFASWVASAAGRTSMPRQREELVAHYWQRFCVKNDTIGFFGPVGWGRFDRDVRGVVVEPGRGLVTRSEVYFSGWAIDSLARVIGADPRVREWLAPRRLPFVGVGSGVVRVPGRPAQPIPAELAEVLTLCDGTRSPARLADELSIRFGRSVSLAEVTAALAELYTRRWIVQRLDVPFCAHPERELRTLLERIGDPAAKVDALAKLEVLEHGRDRIRAAGHDPDALTAAMAELETDFETVTSVAGHRDKGRRTTACRALVYSDCRRSATVRLGASMVEELRPLSLCLLASRWMSSRFAQVLSNRIGQAYHRLRKLQAEVDLASLWMECLPAPHAESIADIEAIQAEARNRWARIIDAEPGARRVRLSAAEIADQVHAAFGAHSPVWPQARYVSPDIFVVASDAAAVERGEFELVLGEMHVAMNTIAASLWVMQHPDRDRLIEEVDRDFPGPQLLPMLPKELPPRWSIRSRLSLDRSEDYYVSLVDHTVDPERPRTFNSADVLVSERAGQLLVTLPDGAEFDLLDVFGNAMTHRVMDRFSVRAGSGHSPRVTVDRMVIARESWTVPAAELAFANEKSEARRYVLTRRWQAEMGLPRFVFIVSPTEPRPFYLDFDAPIYVNIFTKAVRRLARQDPKAELSITEMLPTPEQTWLTDDEGNRYASELRFIAVHGSD